MSENTPLTNLLIDAVEGHLSEEYGGGILSGLLAVVEFQDTDGTISHLVVSPDSQPNPRSIGLAEYASELHRMMARAEFAACAHDDDDEYEDEE